MECRKSTAPIHADLKVTKLGGTCKPRKLFCFTGLSSECDFGVYNSDLNSLERAIKERVFFVKKNGVYSTPYRPTAQSFADVLSNFKSKIKKAVQYTTPMEAMRFAESYQGRRRTVYIAAARDNLTFGFHDKLSFIRAFVKAEKYNFTAKPDAVPRIIQPRDPRYLVETGRYIKPIEKKIYKTINDIDDDVVVYKGLNMQKRGKHLFNTWNKYIDPVAIGLDASRFDQHVSNAALEWEHSVYGMYYPDDKHFKRLMGLQRNNRCSAYVADGHVRYKTKHNRMSGDSNTSLGNVLIMCGMVYAFREFVSVPFSLVNDGDDCVIICERYHTSAIQQAIKPFFHTLGFTMEVEDPVDVFERIVFCQCQPVLDNTGSYTMVRDPRISTAKDAVSLKPLDCRHLDRRWLAAVGMGGTSLTAGMPVLQAYYQCYTRNSLGAKPLSDPTLEGGFFRNSKGMTLVSSQISDQSRLSFWLAFDIPPQSQLVLEEYYDQLSFTEGSLGMRFKTLPLSDF